MPTCVRVTYRDHELKVTSYRGSGRLAGGGVRSGYRWAVVVVVLGLLLPVFAIPAVALEGSGAGVWEQGGPVADAAGCAGLFRFAHSPVPVAKTADGQTTLATVQWGYSASQGLCYLVLDDDAVAVLRANPPRSGTPASGDRASADRCQRAFNADRGFAGRPVPVAKAADGQTTLATVQWGYNAVHNLCYLVLDDAALEALRAAHQGIGNGGAGGGEAGGGVEEPVLVLAGVGGDAGLVAVSSRAHHGHWCGLRGDGVALCTDLSRRDVRFLTSEHGAPGGRFTSVSAGRALVCGVRLDHTVMCWGWDDVFSPASSPGGRFTSVSAGMFDEFACGVREDRAAVCWGDSEFDWTGRMDAPGGRFTSVSAGWEHACGIKEDHAVVCWGDDKHGRTQAPAGRFKSVSSGFWFSCGIKHDDTAVCWGLNNKRGYNAPGGRFISVSAGQHLACGIRHDETAVCWGPPQPDRGGELDAPEGRFASVSAGLGMACGLRPDGTLECWGDRARTWPGPCPVSGSLAPLCWDNVATRWPLAGKSDVYVYYCAAEGEYTPADLRYETDRMNDIVSAFYARESSGFADLRFLPAAVLSPDIDWHNASIAEDSMPCVSVHGAGPGSDTGGHFRPDYASLLWLLDISPDPSGVDRDAWEWCPGACAHYSNSQVDLGRVWMPTVEALYSSPYICPGGQAPRLVRELPGTRTPSHATNYGIGNIRPGHNTSCRDLAYWVYDYLVAHEIGHAAFKFPHPPDCSIMGDHIWNCPPTRPLKMDDNLRNPNLLDTSYIGCAERRQAGWPLDPQRCPQDS